MNPLPVARFSRFAFSIAFGLLAFRAAAETQVRQEPLGLAAVNLVIDPLMTEWVGKHKGPGAVVVVVTRDAEVFAKGYGFADIDAKKPFTADATLVRPGSISKLFTAIAVMQLVEAGKLDLDRDVNRYIDFPIQYRRDNIELLAGRLFGNPNSPNAAIFTSHRGLHQTNLSPARALRGARGFVMGRRNQFAYAAIFALLFAADAAMAESGIASAYPRSYQGRRTASGEHLNTNAMTCAHRRFPFGSMLRVTAGKKSITCRVTDRGPFGRGRVIDLTPVAARALGFSGLAHVTIERM